MQSRLTRASSVLLGFSLASLAMPKTAHAGYYASGWITIIGATSLGGTTTGLGVYLTVRAGQSDGNRGARGSARDMIDGLVLDTKGDIGVQARVLAQSPSAFAQLTYEAQNGLGAGLDALASATNLPTHRVATAWMETVGASNGVSDESAAMDTTRAFFERIAPELAPRPEDIADISLALIRESAEARPEDARLHVAFARAMGVETAVVAAATRDAVLHLACAPDALPAFLRANPGAFADALAAGVAEREPDAVLARAQAYWAPPA